MTEEWFRKADEAALGTFGERVTANVIVEAHGMYIPLCQIERGGAPLAMGKRSIVLPDFQCHHQYWKAPIDAKCKKSAVLWRTSGQVRHGINLSNYKEYERYGELVEQNAALMVVECFTDVDLSVWSGSILVQTLKRLGGPIHGFNEPTPKVYWPRKAFKLLGSFTVRELCDIADGRVVPCFEEQLIDVFCGEVAQQALF